MIAQVPQIWRRLPTVRYRYLAAQLWHQAPEHVSHVEVDGCKEPMDLLYNNPAQDMLPKNMAISLMAHQAKGGWSAEGDF